MLHSLCTATLYILDTSGWPCAQRKNIPSPTCPEIVLKLSSIWPPGRRSETPVKSKPHDVTVNNLQHTEQQLMGTTKVSRAGPEICSPPNLPEIYLCSSSFRTHCRGFWKVCSRFSFSGAVHFEAGAVSSRWVLRRAWLGFGQPAAVCCCPSSSSSLQRH